MHARQAELIALPLVPRSFTVEVAADTRPRPQGDYVSIANGGNETHQKRDGQQEASMSLANMSLDSTSHPGRPACDELVPSRYALRVGEIDVLVVRMGCYRCQARCWDTTPTRTSGRPG